MVVNLPDLGYDINELLQAAQTRWLKPVEVLFILQNHANYQITQEAPQKPPSGSVFLFNKRVLRFFRKDGYSWRKKKDGRTVGEAHERLKVGNAEALNCYYAHGEENPTFQRRSYWMLDREYEHIVLVHYREITEGKLSSGSMAELSSGTSSLFSQSPSAYTIQKPVSSCLSDVHESYQSYSSPGSIEVSSDATMGTGIDCLSGSNPTVNMSMSSDFEVSQALRRLEVQLSLDGDSVKEYAPVDDQDGNEDLYGVLDDLYDSRYAEALSKSNGPSQQEYSGGNEVHHDVTPGMVQSIKNGESLCWKGFLELSKDSLNLNEEGEKAYILNEIEKEPSSSGRTAEPVNHQPQAFEAQIAGKWTEAAKDMDMLTYSPQIYSSVPELSNMLLDSNLGMSLGADSSLTVAKEQKFTICEISPEWGFADDSTKVVIIGSFLCDPSESRWLCMFGDVEVPLQIVQNGVLLCQAPPHPSGKVTLCITSGNRESCSEIREFEYRNKHRTCIQCDKHGAETTRSTEEMLLLVRLVQMLLSDSLLRQGEGNELGADKQKINCDSWNQIIESLLVGGATSVDTLDWLLQQLLKDKLQLWLSSRPIEGGGGDCSLSRKEQGIIHMVAGLGYEWALNPILECGVGINFRDINGWTALHWAARFGREKMVASLIALGASAGALTDPSSHDPTGRNAAYIAATSGHKGLAGYLSELALTSHLSSLTLEESVLSKGSADVEAELTINNISKENVNSTEDQLSLKHTLAAVRNAAQAAARIQSAFRAHSFRKRRHRGTTSLMAITDLDEYGFSENDIQGLSAASKLAFHNLHDHQKAALSIQKNYRGWKGRKDFLTLRQKVVKIQAHVRGYQVRKKYKVICWAVGILDKVVLRWRRKGVGLRGFKPESDHVDEDEDDDDVIKVFRKEKVNVAIDEAVTRVLSMVESPEAQQQYHRMLGRFQEAKAELQGLTSPEASGSEDSLLNMTNDDKFVH
ncbi:calmodulin-binding transcription activator 4 isoform X2 [Beta vulgaris subsp. vulgaris]|uniref:calmodulin-binding transcription activator 4 isoform X2 n=1 Tax=Beta vulgaris subsp. vulgaris TaxID=3555 RepID=UPI002037000F|nr:calmodulin-binding transcription activator 4 isoform X2 [Beta vulgaris subsp. vulgaris]